MWTGQGRTSPGAPFLFDIHRARPRGVCAGSENRRLSAASPARRLGLHQPRRLDAWLAERSTTNFTSRREARRARGHESPGRGFRSRVAGAPSPAGGRQGRVLAGYRRTAVEHGLPRQDEPEGSSPGGRGPRRAALAADGGAAVPSGGASRQRRAGEPPARAVAGWRRMLVGDWKMSRLEASGVTLPRQSDSTSDADAMPASRRHRPHFTQSRSSVRSVG